MVRHEGIRNLGVYRLVKSNLISKLISKSEKSLFFDSMNYLIDNLKSNMRRECAVK